MHKFAEANPDRYENLCKIVGEFALGVMGLYIGVTLPFSSDKGCVVASVVKDGIINVVDSRYF